MKGADVASLLQGVNSLKLCCSKGADVAKNGAKRS